MQRINVVSHDDVCHHFIQEIPGFIQSRIEIMFSAILHKKIFIFKVKMVFIQLVYLLCRICYAVRIDPSVHLHASPVRFFDDKLKGIIVRRRTFALFPVQVIRPRLQVRRIKTVGRRANLKYNGVDAAFLQSVKHFAHLVALLGWR